MKNNEKIVSSILKPFTEAPAINVGGHFGVEDNNKRNMLRRADTSYENVMRCIMSTHPELNDNKELYDAVSEMVLSEMQTVEYAKTK